MRVTITHTKNPDDVKKKIEAGLDDVFKGLPVGPVKIEDEKRAWTGHKMDFSFTAKAAFMSVPVKGMVLIEPKLLTVDVELPAYLKGLIPEDKVVKSVEAGVKGLLT